MQPLRTADLFRRTDHGRCAPLLPVGVVLIAGGCALSGLADSLWTMAIWSGVMGLGHLCFVIGAQSRTLLRELYHHMLKSHHRELSGASERADEARSTHLVREQDLLAF